MLSIHVMLCIGFGLVLAAILFFGGLFTVEESNMAIVERFGKFSRLAKPGLCLKWPFIEEVDMVSLRVQQLDVEVETKTKDNVFVGLKISIQYQVQNQEAGIFASYYKLNDPSEQIESYVFDVVRASVPKMNLDDLFENKDEIANSVKNQLKNEMDDFGFIILRALVTDIDPDAKVKAAMNEINAAQRERVAASERGEADRIMKVKAAEAEAQSKALQGKGIADQRKAIIDGLRKSVEDFQESVEGTTARDVMNLVLMTQYFDTLKEMGNGNTRTIVIPHSPSALTDIESQFRNAFLSTHNGK